MDSTVNSKMNVEEACQQLISIQFATGNGEVVSEGDPDMEVMPMNFYHGSIKKFDYFTQESVVQNLPNGIDTMGLWFTADIHSAKPFAIGTETIIQKSATEFWDDGEPKVMQLERPVRGYIYKVYMFDPNLKEYESYDLFMEERDRYCDYFATGKKQPTWRDNATLLNKEEANNLIQKNLTKQGYEGIVIRNKDLENGVTDLYCFFSADSLQIAEVFSVEDV